MILSIILIFITIIFVCKQLKKNNYKKKSDKLINVQIEDTIFSEPEKNNPKEEDF